MKKTILSIAISSLTITICLGQTTDHQYIAERAAVDAYAGFPKLHLRPGRDGHFNWFEVGATLDEAAEHVWTGFYHRDKSSPEYTIYHKAFKDEINRICWKIQDDDIARWFQFPWTRVEPPRDYPLVYDAGTDPMFSAQVAPKPAPTINVVVEQSNPQIAKAESQLRRAWNLLSPAGKRALRDEQEHWAQIMENNSNEEAQLQMIRDRTIYLLGEVK